MIYTLSDLKTIREHIKETLDDLDRQIMDVEEKERDEAADLRLDQYEKDGHLVHRPDKQEDDEADRVQIEQLERGCVENEM